MRTTTSDQRSLLSLDTLNPGKRTISKILLFGIIGLMISSCSQDLLEGSQPFPVDDTERVDMAIDGAININFHSESDNGLVITYQNPLPLFNQNEHVIRIALDEVNTLELVLYNASLNDPFSDILFYSSYPVNDIEDKSVYIIANYVAGEGDVMYSTTLDFLPPHIQPNVFEIRQIDEDGFNARIRDLTLYEIDRSVTPFSINSININGTFISKND